MTDCRRPAQGVQEGRWYIPGVRRVRGHDAAVGARQDRADSRQGPACRQGGSAASRHHRPQESTQPWTRGVSLFTGSLNSSKKKKQRQHFCYTECLRP